MKNENNYPILKGVKVLELEGYLPVVFLGKLLRDLGAEVLLVKQIKENEIMKIVNHLHDGKRSIKLDLKETNQLNILKKLIQKSDILIDGYRPGILEKLGLSPNYLLSENKKLIVVRVTGYGQEGLMHMQPGHEINYLSLSGALDFFKNEDNKIVNPMIILGDLFCGSLMPMFHISQALLNRQINGGFGCVIDSAITTNLLSVSALTNKFVDKDKVYFSCVTKNYEYILFYLQNDENMPLYLKRICERLIIEVLNISDISEGTRLSITRDYIDFFQLITKSVADTKRYIKEICRMLSQEEIIKNLKKFKFVEVYPVTQFKDVIKFLETSNIIKGNNYINPFFVQSVNKYDNSQNPDMTTDIFYIIKDINISEKELAELIKNNNGMKAKL